MNIENGKKRFTRADLVYRSGLVALCKWITRKDIKIITVHGVINDSPATWRPLRWQLGTQELRNYLSILVQEYEFIDPDEAIAMLTGNIPRRSNCAIFTIDDGYVNSLTQAIPVLNEFGIKPFIFVVTNMVGSSSLFWFDRLDLALQTARGNVKSVELGPRVINLDPSTHESYSDSCRQIIQASREVFESDIDRIAAVEKVIVDLYESANKIETITDDIRNTVGVLSHDEMMQCVKLGAEIGSHTVNHVRLPFVAEEKVAFELRESKLALEEWLGRECKTVCYPEGAMNETVSTLAQETGYQVAFAVSPEGRLYNRDIMNLYRVHLPRVASKAQLLASISGLSETVHSMKNRLVSFVRQCVAFVFRRTELVSGNK